MEDRSNATSSWRRDGRSGGRSRSRSGSRDRRRRGRKSRSKSRDRNGRRRRSRSPRDRKESERDREKDREKKREREKKGLPPIKKNHLSGNLHFGFLSFLTIHCLYFKNKHLAQVRKYKYFKRQIFGSCLVLNLV